MTRDIEKLYTVESIKGSPIDKETVQELEKIAKRNKLLKVEIGSANSFSKPMQFFRDQKNKFQYLQQGKLIPYDKLSGKKFIAFQVKKQTLIVYGFFPGEY